MKYIEFDRTKPLDFIPIGRIAIDFNPTDMYKPLSQSSNFNKYVGGSPANIAVGLARLGCKVGFCGCVSADQFGDYVVEYFQNEGIDTSHVTRAKNGECIGLTFTEILSKEQSSILMYRDNVADFCLAPEDIDEALCRPSVCLHCRTSHLKIKRPVYRITTYESVFYSGWRFVRREPPFRRILPCFS